LYAQTKREEEKAQVTYGIDEMHTKFKNVTKFLNEYQQKFVTGHPMNKHKTAPNVRKVSRNKRQ